MIKINFEYFTRTLERIENTNSQNEMVALLSSLFQNLGEAEIDKVCYLVLGRIAPQFEDINLGLSEKTVQSAISLASGVSKNIIEEETRSIGDIGEVAGKMVKNTQNPFKDYFNYNGELSVKDIFEGLRKIASTGGKGSQEIKKKILASMLIEADEVGRKYIARFAEGTMRLGAGDMTILNALSVAFFDSKQKKSELEHAYNISSDIGLVAKVLETSGIEGVNKLEITIFRPIKAMLAQRVSNFEDIKKKIGSHDISAEEKFDGERIQAHKDGKNVKLYSRRLTDVTSQFPDLVENIKKYVKVVRVILDGEAMAYDFENDLFGSFQILMRRRRKYDIKEYRKKIPIRYMLFDVLYVDGKSFLHKSYPERRRKLETLLEESKYITLANRRVSNDLDSIDEFFQECINKNLEGIVCKSCAENSYYKAGGRDWTWIKWKKEYMTKISDTLDLVIVGAYSGRGRRSGTYGALLCAAYNYSNDTFETVTKLGTGFSDEQLSDMPERLGDARVNKLPARVEITKEIEPDFCFTPKYVVEVLGSEITKSPVHTCNWIEEEKQGLALRFPRFIKWRDEKSPEQATTTEEILQMYKGQ
ncbi:ATP-dependent DNA ligase [Methanobacterium sp. ACI-7]|uniref:ATP-dependent DNA ligase n=1 Tax=unclassified Methanobacterium TaxID=2627676 RepID=UPI0039C0DCC2